jgi:8-oxo-dGTP pyrophosphatase MutT (NUDIX family)
VSDAREHLPASGDWRCIDAARRRRVPRVPLFVEGDGTPIGSVACAHLDALGRWPGLIDVAPDAVRLRAVPDLDTRLGEVHAALRDDGLIRAWRGERFTLWQPRTMRPLAAIERAAVRFWGTLTLGAHANGYVADDAGRPQALWIARRSWHKPTDPGKLDNLVGGGVPHGQSPFDALVREGWEEAGLDAATMAAARPGRVIALHCDIAEGLQHEHLHVWDLPLPRDLMPRNQDGEVAALRLVPVDEALALAAGDAMTVDAALATLDFALRHRLLDATLHARLADRAASLWRTGTAAA